MQGPLSGFFLQDEEPEQSTLAQIFEEEPVPLQTFVQDKKFLGQTNVELSTVQANAIRHIERVYYPELYPLMAEEFDSEYWAADLPVKNIITLQYGKGAGKDMIARLSSLRIAYLLLCLKSPQLYFQMPETDSIHMLNIAANSGQANQAFFKPMTEAVKRGWFKDKADPKQGHIQYDKYLEAISGHSDAEGQEGLNLILGVADEIDAFKAKDEMVGQGKRAREASTSAESILKMLKGSAATRFPRTYKRVSISYPRYKGSTIQRLTAEGNASIEKYGDSSIHFVSGPLATWEVNPRVSGKEDFAEDYEEDPDAAAAMYECKPTRAVDAYFRNPAIFKNAVVRDESPLTVDYKLTKIKSDQTGTVTEGWEPVYNFAPDFVPIQGANYAMHGDLAIKGDRAGIAMSHVEKWIEQVDMVEDEEGGLYPIATLVPIIKVDFVFGFSAKSSALPPREIQIRWARMLAFELIKRGFYIRSFTFDGFQSADTIQVLNRHGIESKRVSADINDDVWKTLKDVASDGRLHMPFDQLLMDELVSLNRVNNKVDHPPHGCFVGETRIPLLDGTFPQISELVGQQVWVYSVNACGKIKPGLARGRMTKMTTELVDVILDSGYVARCTPEHLWMLRDGSYREAKDLRPGIDRLMPITFNWPVNGGYTRLTDKDGLRTLAHHMVSEHFEGRTRVSHEVVHHKNEVKIDNRPENLEMISQVDHVTHHGNEFWSDRVVAMRAGHTEWAADPERKAAAYSGRRVARFREDVTVDSILGAIREGATNRAEAARILNCDWKVVEGRLRVERVTFPELLASTDNNHKVRAVIPVVLDEPEPVFDLEVDEFHNFALSGGVFVHNSKDLADALACSIVGAIEAGGEEDADGRSTEVGVPFFEVGSAISELEGSDEVGFMLGGPLELPIGMKGMM
jgi:hypothetical protein